MYQREATARVEAGITNQDTIDKNRAQVRADAAARNAAFQASKSAANVNRVARRTPENTGTGRDGTFGAGTVGQGMPSNPDFRGPGNNKAFAQRQTVAALPSDYKETEAREFAKAAAFKEQQKAKEAAVNKASREGAASTGIPSGSNLKAGSFGISAAGKKQAEANKAEKNKATPAQKTAIKKSTTVKKSSPSTTKSSPSTSKSGSKRSSRGAKSGGSKSGGSKSGGSKSGGSKSGGSKSAGSKKSSRGAKGSSSSRSKGGTSKGTSRRSNTRRSRRRCDIRCKFDISILTNQNLIRDDLADVAYFVKNLQEIN